MAWSHGAICITVAVKLWNMYVQEYFLSSIKLGMEQNVCLQAASSIVFLQIS